MRLSSLQPDWFFGRLHVSVDTARVLHFLDSLFSLALWLFYMCPSLAQLAISGCIHIEGSVASSLIDFSVLHVSVDTARVLHFLDSLFSLALWLFYMCPSLAQLVISGCIRIEGSVASSLLGFSVACISKLRTQLTRLTRLTQLSLLTLAYTADTGHMVYTVVRPHTAYTHSAYTAD